MLCERCGQKEATVKFVQIENNKKTELHLCRDCAQGYSSFAPGFDLQQLLASMFESFGLGQKAAPSVETKKCPTCGRSIADIQNTGRIGCSSCYEVFRAELNPVSGGCTVRAANNGQGSGPFPHPNSYMRPSGWEEPRRRPHEMRRLRQEKCRGTARLPR